jgi:hypothetical protein
MSNQPSVFSASTTTTQQEKDPSQPVAAPTVKQASAPPATKPRQQRAPQQKITKAASVPATIPTPDPNKQRYQRPKKAKSVPQQSPTKSPSAEAATSTDVQQPPPPPTPLKPKTTTASKATQGSEFKCPITDCQNHSAMFTEEEFYHHFTSVHCYDFVSPLDDSETRSFGFDVCNRCCFVSLRGLLVKHKCWIPKHRHDLKELWAREVDLFRKGFLQFDFASLEIGTHMPSLNVLFNYRAPTLNYMPGSH